MNATKSLGHVLKAFANVVKDLFYKNPVLFLVLVYLSDLGIRSYIEAGYSKILLLDIIILVVSIGIYISTKSISQTTLSFILGLLTVYTIDWEKSSITLFMILYITYFIIIFFIGSVRLSAKQETILIQATNKLADLSDNRDYKHVFKRLKKISLVNTKSSQLTIIEKSEVIRYLAFRQVAIGEYEDAINTVELIKTVCQIDLGKSCELYYSLYTFSKNKLSTNNHSKEVINILDRILTIPMPHEEFFNIFRQTKKLLFQDKINLNDYFIKIKLLAIDGFDEDEIIGELNDSYM
ncbi:hypothetical protein [Acetivibrio mesophilus]|uniref:Uncharacterized protein n=1 Tax=Acetivibrio mesophilus TaxID=2487273 RepID=A0A4Q0I4Z3_9FIRM|nr:hypothetical protein [Acetivibrio mesophilus]RXE58022.1 hypothetical protein EFD62_14680 [Acetivibrio mesophilus]